MIPQRGDINAEEENGALKEEASLTKKSSLRTTTSKDERVPMDEYIPAGHGKLTSKCDNEPNGDAACGAFKEELPSQPPPWPGDAKSLLAIFLPTAEAVYHVLAFPWTHSSRRGAWQWITLFHGKSRAI
jgi:hypothetical protein